MADLLAGRTAFITGGGGAIGLSAALAMVREGANVVVVDHDAAAAGRAVTAIEGAGGRAFSVVGDVADADFVSEAVAAGVNRFGRIDIGFNNAGIGGAHVGYGGRRMAEWSDDAFDRIVAVCLRGVWLCMKAQLAAMVEQGGGVIINTASTAGVAGLAGSSAYAAAKHGVVGLTRSAAREYAKDGIRVNAICPGTIETNMSAEPMRRRGADVVAQIPMGRIGKPSEIGEVVTWLCTDHASYITGVDYLVDGGFLA